MTAPKIDTQAPERVWLKPCDPCKAPDDYYVCDPDCLDGRETEYILASFSAAREAAAVERAFRDGLAYATNCRVKDHDQAWQQSLARERLGTTTALDRLIAERLPDCWWKPGEDPNIDDDLMEQWLSAIVSRPALTGPRLRSTLEKLVTHLSGGKREVVLSPAPTTGDNQ